MDARDEHDRRDPLSVITFTHFAGIVTGALVLWLLVIALGTLAG